MRDYISEAVQRHSTRIKDSKIFFAPDIPRRKLRKALKAYAKEVEESDVLFLIDNTVFGGAKEGLLLTADRLYVNNMMEHPKSMDLQDVTSVSFNPLDFSYLDINGTEFFQVTAPEEKSMLLVAEMLRDVCNIQNPVEVAAPASPSAPAEKDPVEALKDLKDLHDSGILSDAEYDEKRQPYLDQL